MATDIAPSLETIVSLCKRRGFVYPSADIYGGLNGVYDFGHLGTLMKQNLRTLWIHSLNSARGEIVQIEGALLGPEAIWKASGHVDGFHDPMVDCKACKKRYRADELDLKKGCPSCGKNDWTDIRQFNMMFKTQLGASESASTTSYLRPETAQAIFTNFKNVLSTNRIKIPFGIAQMGKAFRNEITPKQFLFRMREFEQMEMQWFCTPDQAAPEFENWVKQRLSFYQMIGINTDKIRTHNHSEDELAHYAAAALDIQYEFPFGWKELEGIHNRSDFDLSQHTKHSGKDLAVFDEATKTSYTPHVVECSVGLDRLFLTVLFDAYHEDTIDGETRIVLKLHPAIAPIKLAFLPLTQKLNEQAYKLYEFFAQQGVSCQFDTTGSIGKRYRRQDEIGTPFCITYDFDSLEDGCVTVRNRDTTKQERVQIENLAQYLGF